MTFGESLLDRLIAFVLGAIVLAFGFYVCRWAELTWPRRADWLLRRFGGGQMLVTRVRGTRAYKAEWLVSGADGDTLAFIDGTS